MSKLDKQTAISTYGYYHEDIDGSKTVNLNDKIWFGSYPQQQVEDSATLAALNDSATTSWTSYGYYVSGEKSDVMSYQDVTIDGNKYRGVKIDDYRPYYTDMASTENYIEGNGFTKGNVYWFAFSPIEWRVLDNVDGTVMLNSVDCLDGQSFNNTYDKNGTQYFNKGTQVYSNDWEGSYIRDWLNSSFISWAFTSEEQSKLVAQTLDNKNSSYDAESTYAASQNNTTDKVYLLSYKDLYNSNYGFPDVTNANHTSLNDATVCKEGTAYSHSQGARASVQAAGSWWMLRTAGGKSFSVCGISKYGDITKSNTVTYPVTAATDGICFYTAEGISPVINIKIGK
jgi:hypothetical protein